jgi:hypothetical protein
VRCDLCSSMTDSPTELQRAAARGQLAVAGSCGPIMPQRATHCRRTPGTVAMGSILYPLALLGFRPHGSPSGTEAATRTASSGDDGPYIRSCP